jgi:hypothetical protein
VPRVTVAMASLSSVVDTGAHQDRLGEELGTKNTKSSHAREVSRGDVRMTLGIRHGRNDELHAVSLPLAVRSSRPPKPPRSARRVG